MYFLLVYSLEQTRLVHRSEFKDQTEAIRAYDAAEHEYGVTTDRFEVVLVGADCVEQVKQTHGHYFSASDISLFSEFLTDTAPR